MSKSEFGKGLTYCLGLFLCHDERDVVWTTGDRKVDRADIWFNGASDHMYELEIPDFLPDDLKARLTFFKDTVLTWGHGFQEPCATEKDKYWAIREAKALLRAIDTHFGIITVQGDNE